MKSPTLSLDNTQRFALVLTCIAVIGMIVLSILNYLWFITIIMTVALTLWFLFILVLSRNYQVWNNIVFYALCIVAMFSALQGITMWWLASILLCALAGWDLMHLYLRLTEYDDEEIQGAMAPILKQHYQRLGGTTLVGAILVLAVNLIELRVHFGWNLLWLLVAGGAIRYIVRWIRKRYA